jgi:hypothetical protein
MSRSCRAGWCGSVAVSLLLSAVGCGGKKGDLPTTFKVQGTVVYEEDSKPMVSGSVQFEPIDGPAGSTACVGTTQANGNFEMRTIRDNAEAPGVPEGSYRVRLTPPMGADQRDRSVVLPGPFKVEPNDSNLFKFTVPGKSTP